MRSRAILLAAAITACGLGLNPDRPHSRPNLGPAIASGAEESSAVSKMPKELYGFSGSLTGKVLRPGQDWLVIRVIEVMGISSGNKARLTLKALTDIWKDKTVAVRGVKDMALLKAGDTVTVVAVQFEEHLRATKVVKQDAPNSGAKKSPGDGGVRPSAAKPTKGRFAMETYTYKTAGDVKIEADVYRPEDSQPRPVLVWLHGGALMMGSKKWVQPDLMQLCRSEGYCLVSANYRLAPQARLPQIIEDLRDLMKWVGQKGPGLFHADASRVVVAGSSAGGYLTMMTGIIEPRPKGLVAYYGYGDVDGPWYTTPSERYRKQPLVSKADAWKGTTPDVVTEPAPGGLHRGRLYLYFRQNGLWTREVTGFDPAKDKAKLDPYCPVRNITPRYPPIVMIHGTADTDVPCQESLDMAEQLKRNNVRHEMFAIPGAGHGLGGGDRQRVAKAMARARQFIKDNLGPEPGDRPRAGSAGPAR